MNLKGNMVGGCGLAEDRYQWRTLVNTVMELRIA
jgi:hypothetical protein